MSRPDMVARHLSVRGRVQGVWYRGSAREEAAELGLVGWCRNLSDGSVEIVAQGERDVVDRFVSWCQQGPSGARVTEVRSDPYPVDDALTDFRIR